MRIARDTLTPKEARRVAILDDLALDLVHEVLQPPHFQPPFPFTRAVPGGSVSARRGGSELQANDEDSFRARLNDIIDEYLVTRSPVHETIREWLIDVWAKVLYGPAARLQLTETGHLTLHARSSFLRGKTIPGVANLTMNLEDESNLPSLKINDDFIDWIHKGMKDTPYAWVGPIRLLRQGCKRCSNTHWVLRPLNPGVILPDGANLQWVSTSRPIVPDEELWVRVDEDAQCNCKTLYPAPARGRVSSVKRERDELPAVAPTSSVQSTPTRLGKRARCPRDGTPVGPVIMRRRRLPTPTPTPSPEPEELAAPSSSFSPPSVPDVITANPIPELSPGFAFSVDHDHIKDDANARTPTSTLLINAPPSSGGGGGFDGSLLRPRHGHGASSSTSGLTPSPPSLTSASLPEQPQFQGPYSSSNGLHLGVKVAGATSYRPLSSAASPVESLPTANSSPPWLVPAEPVGRSALVSPSEQSQERTTSQGPDSPSSAPLAHLLMDFATEQWMAGSEATTLVEDDPSEPTDKKVERLRRELTQALMAMRIFEARSNALMGQKTDLQRQLDDKDRVLRGLDERLMRHLEEINAANRKATQAERKEEEAQQLVAAIQEQLHTLEQANATLTVQCRNDEARAAQRVNKCQTLTAKNKALEADNNRLRAESNEAANQVSHDLATAQETIKVLQQTRDDRVAEVERVRAERTLLEQKVGKLQGDYDREHKERTRLLREVEEGMELRRQERNDLVRLEQEVKGGEKERNKLREKVVGLDRVNILQTQRLSDLDQELSKLHRENIRLNHENIRLQSEVKRYRQPPHASRHSLPVSPLVDGREQFQTMGNRSVAQSSTSEPFTPMSVPPLLPSPTSMMAGLGLPLGSVRPSSSSSSSSSRHSQSGSSPSARPPPIDNLPRYYPIPLSSSSSNSNSNYTSPTNIYGEHVARENPAYSGAHSPR